MNKTPMPRNFDYTGYQFGDIKVLGEAPRSPTTGQRYVMCECLCGKVWPVNLASLVKDGGGRSCGCKAAAVAKARHIHDEGFTPPSLSRESALEAIDYNPHTGVFTWKTRPRKHFSSDLACKLWNGQYAGEVAGHTDTRGYVVISVFKRYLRSQQLIVLITEGFIPDAADHINGDKSDNRLCNIRVATRSQNQFNQKKGAANKSGVKGVWFSPQKGTWVSQIRANNVRYSVGSFKTLDEATKAIREAREKLHGEFANHG